MTDTRVIDTPQLELLAEASIASEFNRIVDPTWVRNHMDPDGKHIAWIILWGHDTDHAPILHHRIAMYCKVKDTSDPFFLVMDISDDNWQKLSTVDETLGA